MYFSFTRQTPYPSIVSIKWACNLYSDSSNLFFRATISVKLVDNFIVIIFSSKNWLRLLCIIFFIIVISVTCIYNMHRKVHPGAKMLLIFHMWYFYISRYCAYSSNINKHFRLRNILNLFLNSTFKMYNILL